MIGVSNRGERVTSSGLYSHRQQPLLVNNILRALIRASAETHEAGDQNPKATVSHPKLLVRCKGTFSYFPRLVYAQGRMLKLHARVLCWLLELSQDAKGYDKEPQSMKGGTYQSNNNCRHRSTLTETEHTLKPRLTSRPEEIKSAHRASHRPNGRPDGQNK